jgi:hypothetical protein
MMLQGCGLKTVEHSYNLRVLDYKNSPIEGAKIEYSLDGSLGKKQSGVYMTPKDGVFFVKAVGGDTPYLGQYQYENRTNLNFTVSKEGYFPVKSDLSLMCYASYIENLYERSSKDIFLVKPEDYFLDNANKIEFVKPMSEIVNSLQELCSNKNANVPIKSIGISEYDKKDFLRIFIDNGDVYNFLKLSKYAIGGKMFDDYVVNIISDNKNTFENKYPFSGYDIAISTNGEDFLNKGTTREQLVYRFLVYKGEIELYKSKKITGQQVLNSSVILLNEKRIQINLQ